MKLIKLVQAKLDQLNPRERKLVTWGVTFLGLCAVWFVLIDPALQTLNGAEERRAQLVEKTARVKRAAMDLQDLQGTRSRVILKADDALSQLRTLLQENQLGGSAEIGRNETGAVEVTFQEASVVQWLRWLTQTEGLSNLTLLEAQISKGQAGVVSGSLVFDLLESEQAK
ncbi:MAG: type II secretion system protein GspM [Limnobacter sp.]|nr:type II secretion system protein GspM [Limnobacter sp.]